MNNITIRTPQIFNYHFQVEKYYKRWLVSFWKNYYSSEQKLIWWKNLK